MKNKANQRLAELVPPAVARLAKLIHDKRGNVALGAVKDVLDRCGLKSVDRSEIKLETSEEGVLLAEIFTSEELARIHEHINERVKARARSTERKG